MKERVDRAARGAVARDRPVDLLLARASLAMLILIREVEAMVESRSRSRG